MRADAKQIHDVLCRWRQED